MARKANTNKKDENKEVKKTTTKASSSKKSTTNKTNATKKSTDKVVNKNATKKEKVVPKKIEVKEEVIEQDNIFVSKTKGLLIAGGVVLFLVLIFFLSGGEVAVTNSSGSAADFNEIELDDYLDYKEETELSIVYVGRPTCSYCGLLEPILKDVAGQYNLEINYLNTDEFSETEQSKFMASDSYFNEGYGTPLVLLLQNGEIVDMIEGYVEETTIVDFFVTNGVIEEVIEDDLTTAEEVLNLISIDQYLSIKSGSEAAIVYVGRPTCSYCELLKPSLNMITSDYGVVINYLNTDTLSSDEQQQFMNSDSYFNDGYGTPLVLLVQNDEIVDMIEGYVEEDQVVSFFKEHGFIN